MEAINVSTTITQAEVYRHGCTVTCVGEATLGLGENRLVIGGLPDGLDEGSISLRMPAGIRQGQVRLLRADTYEVDEGDDELRGLCEQVDELDRRIENRELELEAWKGIAANASGPTSLEYLERLPEKLDELTRGLADLRRERRDVARRRDDLREVLLRPRLQVDVDSQLEGSLPLELRCRSSHAGWRPAYDVLVDKVGDPLRMRLKGEVWQQTGIDWHDVTLRLSSGTSTVSHDLPRFFPRYLSRYVPARRDSYAKAAMGSAPSAMPSPLMKSTRMADDALEATGFTFEELAAPEAMVEEQATVTTYELVGPQTLPSGMDEQTLTVMTRELAATYLLYTYPRKEEAAYLVARLEEEPSPEVLEQPLSVYLEGSYAGAIRIGRTDDEEGYELPLGRDDRVRVRRAEDTRHSRRLLGGKVTDEHQIDILVEGRRPEVAQLVVLEQVPVSRDKDIEVVVRETSGASYDADRGELRWTAELGSDARLSWTVTYAVSHAKDVRVQSEERRQTGGDPSGSGLPFCPTCGARLPHDTTFCPSCGSVVR